MKYDTKSNISRKEPFAYKHTVQVNMSFKSYIL